MKLITDIPGVDNLVARVNEELPPEIRLWDMVCFVERNHMSALNPDGTGFLASCSKVLQRPKVCVSICVSFFKKIFHTNWFNLVCGNRSCDSRRYTYFFPTYLLIPPKPGSGLFRTFHGLDASTAADIDRSTLHPFWRESDPNTTHEEDMARKRRFRASPEEIAALREAVRLYEGTHNFHNFTVGRDFKDRSNQRHLKKIEVINGFSLFTEGTCL